jgi:hypothetical protein
MLGFFSFKNKNRGEVAALLTIVFFGLMALGIGVGTKLAQTPTNLNSYACITQCAICTPVGACNPAGTAESCQVVTFCNGNGKWCWQPDNSGKCGSSQPAPTTPPANNPPPPQPPAANCPSGEWECDLPGQDPDHFCTDSQNTRDSFNNYWCEGKKRWLYEAAGNSETCGGIASTERPANIPYPSPCIQAPPVNPVKSPTPTPTIQCEQEGGACTVRNICMAEPGYTIETGKGCTGNNVCCKVPSQPPGTVKTQCETQGGICTSTRQECTAIDPNYNYTSGGYGCTSGTGCCLPPNAQPSADTGTVTGIVKGNVDPNRYFTIAWCNILKDGSFDCQAINTVNTTLNSAYILKNVPAGKNMGIYIKTAYADYPAEYFPDGTIINADNCSNKTTRSNECIMQVAAGQTVTQNFTITIPSSQPPAGTATIGGYVGVSGDFSFMKNPIIKIYCVDNGNNSRVLVVDNITPQNTAQLWAWKSSINPPNISPEIGKTYFCSAHLWETKNNNGPEFSSAVLETITGNQHVNFNINIPPSANYKTYLPLVLQGSSNPTFAEAIRLWVTGIVQYMKDFLGQLTRAPGIQQQPCDPLLPADNIKSCNYIPPEGI